MPLPASTLSRIQIDSTDGKTVSVDRIQAAKAAKRMMPFGGGWSSDFLELAI